MKNNIWNKINNKHNRKSTYEISKETNIPEKKVEEIMNGERELPTDRVDKFLEVIQKDDKAKRKVEIEQIKNWFDTTDKKAARLKLGYNSQTELSKALGVHPSIICRLENGNREHTSNEMLIKYYDFLTDDLNKVVNKNKVKQTRVSRPRPNRKPKKVKNNIGSKDYDKVFNWWKEFDIKGWLEENDISISELTKELGYNSSSTIYETISHKRGEFESKNVILRLYKYINEQELNFKNEEKEEKKETKEEVRDTLLEELKEVVEESKEETKEESTPVQEVAENKIYIPMRIWEDITKNNFELVKKVDKLEKQIERYEKLIDRL